MNPRPDAETLSIFYSRSALYEYWNKFVFPASQEVRKKKIFRPRVERLIQFCEQFEISMNCLADVGAAGGLFCSEAVATKKFNRVVALEPSASQAENCRQAGIETIEGTVETVRGMDGMFNIITCFEVIEHVFSPADFLKQCKKILAPHGILAVTCPNYLGFDILTLGPLSSSLDAEHINLFNPVSLQLLFQRLGFEILECNTPGQLDAELVRKHVLNGSFSLTNHPFLKMVLLDRWDDLQEPFQNFLSENNLSSHLWLVARLG